MTPVDPPVGLIAGQGRLPVLTALGARAAGRRVACIGLADQYDPELPGLCDRFATAGIIRLGRWIGLLRRWGVHEAVMAISAAGLGVMTVLFANWYYVF